MCEENYCDQLHLTSKIQAVYPVIIKTYKQYTSKRVHGWQDYQVYQVKILWRKIYRVKNWNTHTFPNPIKSISSQFPGPVFAWYQTHNPCTWEAPFLILDYWNCQHPLVECQ